MRLRQQSPHQHSVLEEANMIRNDKIERIASDYIRALFEETKDGVLEIWYEDETDEGFIEAYPVAWSRADMEELVRQFELLRSQLDRIAAGERSEELVEIFNIFVHPYDACPFDDEQMNEVLDKLELALPLTQEERTLYEQYIHWQEKQASSRLLAKGHNAFRLISHTRRYTLLMELKAPQIVIENEARCIAEEMVLYHWSKGGATKQQEEVSNRV
jgi:hypothetical protein